MKLQVISFFVVELLLCCNSITTTDDTSMFQLSPSFSEVTAQTIQTTIPQRSESTKISLSSSMSPISDMIHNVTNPLITVLPITTNLDALQEIESTTNEWYHESTSPISDHTTYDLKPHKLLPPSIEISNQSILEPYPISIVSSRTSTILISSTKRQYISTVFPPSLINSRRFSTYLRYPNILLIPRNTKSRNIVPTSATLMYQSSTVSLTSLLVSTAPPAKKEGQYFVAIKSDDCPKIRPNKFDHELTKALSALGVLNVSANIARTKCQTQLSVNITAMAPYSAIKLLEQSRKQNLTITVFNRTFKIVDIKQLNVEPNELETLNSSSTVVSVLSDNEFNGFLAIAACFGLVLLVSISVCCIKCWAVDPTKRPGTTRNSHSALNPEDYTLTPLPRPTSMYVDYCRNSFSADMRSITSAGSVGSTSTNGGKVVQPFDTSIVPLEDFVVATISDDSRRNSIESAISHKSAGDIPPSNHGLLYFNSIADSREMLHPRSRELNGGLLKAGGVSNPTYQRF